MTPQTTHSLFFFPQPPSGRTPKPSAFPVCGTDASSDVPPACDTPSHDFCSVLSYANLEDDCHIHWSVAVHAGKTLGKDPPIYSTARSCETSLPPSPTLSSTSPNSLLLDFGSSPPSAVSQTPDQPTMVKKRRSLQAILIPPFFHPSISSEENVSPPNAVQRVRSQSAAATTTEFVLPPAIPIAASTSSSSSSSETPRHSPPSDLLDDDPFANLSPGPTALVFDESTVPLRRSSSVLTGVALDAGALPSLRSPRVTPRSPLVHSVVGLDDDYSNIDAGSLPPPAPPPPTPVPARRAATVLPRPRSSASHGQPRPAHTRPAFYPRPSLPSLYTLAQINVVAPKVKRGRVGAKLPAEPWSMIDSLPSGLAGHSYSMSPSGSSSVTDSDMLVQEPESYDSPDDNQESEPDVSRERASFSESDRSTPYMSEAGDVQTRASIISQSSFDAYPSTLIPFETFDTHIPRGVEDDHSSPEPSFPPTPQFTADTPAFLNLGYSSVFSQQSRTSIYEDLSATLEYDYSQAVSQFSSSASEQDAVSSSPSLGESAPCDFQPGSSVQTIRAYNLHDPPSHFRSSSCQDGTAQELSHMDTLPLSPTTIGANIDAPSRTSSGSSAYEDDADFLTVYSDSSDEEYLTAPLSRSPSPTAGLPPLEGSAVQCLQLPYAEEHELSESSGIDITERLSRLSIFSQSDTASSRYVSAPEYVDAAEEGSRGSRTQSHHGESSRHSESSDRHQGTSSSYGGGRAGGMGFGGGSGGGRRDRDGDDDRYRRPYPRSAAPDYATPETSEEEDSSDEDESGRPKLSRRQGRRASSSEGDDVPLAQQIPSALRAQRSIRMQVRDEAVQKRRAKSLRRPGSSGHSAPDPQPALPTQRVTPDHSAGVHVSRAPSTSRALPVLQEPPKPTGRPRTKTLPSQAGGSPFAVGDLTKKLLNVHTAPPLPHSPISPARSSHDQQGPQSPKQSTSRLPSQPDQYANLNPAAQDVSIALRLRNMRSFHRPRTTGGESEPPPPTPSAGAQLGRSNTGATRRPQPPDSQPAKSLPQNAAPSLERARSTRSQSRRPSVDRSARPSVDQDARTPMPPMPTVVKTPAWQQRVFVGTLQRFSQVEITATSTARDVLEILQSQAALEDSVANGWMMWEVCQDFGMERPIRSFEVLSDVTNSWVTDKTVNILMAKKTLLAPKLSRAAIPSSSPVCGGFVQWEHKRGKWQKRWLELREHSLWLSKRDTGKDQIQLCSLNNFDAYIVTRINKAPKPYVFAVKSTDNISFFESTSDYVHIFSCDKKEGENWVEKILLARSYILHQDRNVLSTASTAITSGASLSRSGTRKRPAQPLVNFGAAQGTVTEPPPVAFIPGSLLAKNP